MYESVLTGHVFVQSQQPLFHMTVLPCQCHLPALPDGPAVEPFELPSVELELGES
jgi:hypothetical protein